MKQSTFPTKVLDFIRRQWFLETSLRLELGFISFRSSPPPILSPSLPLSRARSQRGLSKLGSLVLETFDNVENFPWEECYRILSAEREEARGSLGSFEFQGL